MSSVMPIFAILNVFHTRQSTKNTFLLKTTTTLPYTRSPSTQLYSHLPFRTDGFVHKKHLLFLLIDRSVCIIQNNQILDVLINYIAKYHILYSDQLEIRISAQHIVCSYTCIDRLLQHAFVSYSRVWPIKSFNVIYCTLI